jgi:hypothetical protein
VLDRPNDRPLLAEIAAGGNKSEIPRPIQVWIYGTTGDLGEVSRRLEKCVWSIVSFVVDVREEREWKAEVVLSRTQSADEGVVVATSDEIEAALVGTSAVYDGWETSIETGTNATLH